MSEQRVVSRRIAVATAVIIVLALLAWLWSRDGDAHAVAAPRATSSSAVSKAAPETPDDSRAAANAPRESSAPPTAVTSAAPALDNHERAFWGRAIDRDTRRPIGAASVTRNSDDASSAAAHATESATTAADGTFSLRAIDAFSSTFRLAADGWSPVWFVPENGHETRERALDIDVPALCELAVRVRAPDGKPHDHARVAAYFHDEWPLGDATVADRMPMSQRRATGTTDAAGTFVFAALPSGTPITVRVDVEGLPAYFHSDAPILAAGERRALEIVLGGTTRIEGTLVDADKLVPLSGVEIWLVEPDEPIVGDQTRYFGPEAESSVAARAHTDLDGRFAFDAVAIGSWWVGPAPAAAGTPGAVTPIARAVLIDGRAATTSVELRVWRELYVHGRVVDRDGQPAKANVFGAAGTRELEVPAQTDADGRFVLGPLPPGRCELRAVDPSSGCDSAPVDTTPGGPDIELRLRFAVPGRLRVVDHATRNVVVASVEAQRRDGHAARSWQSPEAAEVIELPDLPPGTWDFVATTPDGRIGLLAGIEITEPDRPIELTLEVAPATKLRVRCEHAAGNIELRAERDGAVVAHAWTNGAMPVVLVVPAGELHVIARCNGVASTADAVALPGSLAEVVVRFD
jgi:hypothetical protein